MDTYGDGGDDDDNCNDNSSSSLLMRADVPGTVLSIYHPPCKKPEIDLTPVLILQGRK